MGDGGRRRWQRHCIRDGLQQKERRGNSRRWLAWAPFSARETAAAKETTKDGDGSVFDMGFNNGSDAAIADDFG